ncbi:MAG: leucyl aminopeptidase [bacterium]|nr:leucyl aminopeptidase [bacterium]
MEISVTKEKGLEVEADVLLVPVMQEQDNFCKCTKEFYEYANSQMDFCGKSNEIACVQAFNKIKPKNVMFVGLGEKEEYNLNKLRVAISKACQKIADMKKVSTVAVALKKLPDEPSLAAQTVAEGALIGTYKFDKYKTEKKERFDKLVLISSQDVQPAVKKAQVVCDAVNMTRDLVNEPAELITPAKLASIATSLKGIETKVYGQKEAKKMGMGAFLAVGQGSRHEQQFIHMTYKPKGKARAKVALVGKGITFDSGGLDIKPAASMLEMKGDMAGAACVISVMKALTKLKPNVEVHGIVAACENMPASRSYKPGDVLTAMNGKTIEVDNTDAEGRLTLADALCFAENLEPDAIIDIATLTGACCVALGKVASGLLGNDDELIIGLQASAEEAGEYLWEMPMYEEYFEDLKSDIADFKNSGSRYGGTSAAALFLKKFIKTTPWAHLDIAGTSIISKPLRELPKGVTGVGVRTLINYICNL